MTIKSATPYLILGGKARQAIELYKRALGATVGDLKRFGDMDQSCPEALKDHVMHAELKLGSALLMLSDGPNEEGTRAPSSTISVALSFSDESEARRSFESLAEKGNVFQPLISAPWGGIFGVVIDEFGINWMFNTDPKAG